MKKTRMTKFVETKLKSDSESELKSDTELEAKLKSDSGSDSESVILLSIIFIMFLTIHRGRLTNFELVKNLAVILLTLKKSKKDICQNFFLPARTHFYLCFLSLKIYFNPYAFV